MCESQRESERERERERVCERERERERVGVRIICSCKNYRKSVISRIFMYIFFEEMYNYVKKILLKSQTKMGVSSWCNG